MHLLALDLGGTKLATALFHQDGRLLHKNVVPLAMRIGSQVGELVQHEIKQALDIARAEGFKISSIGVSIPGISDQKKGTVWAPNIPGWESYSLQNEIRAALPNPEIPVEIEGDRACYILGETWQGAAKNVENAIFLAVGTGIGAGILVDGKIIRGAHGISGAIGWLALQKPFRPEYVPCGCFEHHASGTGLVKIAKELIAQHKSYSGELKTNLTTATIFSAHEKGDPIAGKSIEQAIELWGMAVANLVSLFNPEKIIFGGGVFGPATKFLPQIYDEAKKWAQPISIQKVQLEPSRLGGDAGVYGAGYLALRNCERTV